MIKLLLRIKKALASRPTKQELRQAQNREQVNLIIQGIEDKEL